MKTLYLECNMGAAGDMLMGALYEICEKKELFLNMMNEVFTPLGISISAETSRKCGISGTKMRIQIGKTEETVESDHAEHAHASVTYPELLERIHSLTLPDQVKEDAASIYRLIGEAEAKVHGEALDQIHFHEVGTLDALADVTGCALLMYMIVPDQVFCSPIHVGTGFVKCVHGVLPVPAPATAELLKGIPFYTGSIAGELLTPTGAAILKYYVTGFSTMPALKISSIGYGMGTKDFEIANCVRVFLGTENAAGLKSHSPSELVNAVLEGSKDASVWGNPAESFSDTDRILSISCNLDDMTGEDIGLATEILLAAGALDVYTIPIQMKKNRPGILLTCFCEITDKEKFTGLFFLHTTTRGVRFQEYSRAKLESTFESHSSPYGSIRVKKSTGYGVEKEKPEFEDLKSIVLKNGCSIEEIKKAIQ